MGKILVTGGCGYIGAHTLVDLIQNGFDVISVDDNSRSSSSVLSGVQKITGKSVKNYPVDLCQLPALREIFLENKDIIGIIHFAAYKMVGESVQQPLMYFENNLISLINILKCAETFGVHHFIFSSSCTVYGNPDAIPVTESTPLKQGESPYGLTKQMGEQIVQSSILPTPVQAILLRYFNPVGAHPSNEIGETPLGKPANLFPVITQTAIGKMPGMHVHGTDYPTRDGSCVRDYIHVCDIAHAHTLALEHLIQKKNTVPCDVFNLGTGDGYTVLEVINAFEKISGVPLNYSLGPRREGDVIAIYANNNKAKQELGWIPQFDLNTMMKTAWDWELKNK